MLIRLKRIDRKENEPIMFNFPYEESEISNVYNQLELETSTAPNCYIEEVVYDSDMNEVLRGWIVSIQGKEKYFLHQAL